MSCVCSCVFLCVLVKGRRREGKKEKGKKSVEESNKDDKKKGRGTGLLKKEMADHLSPKYESDKSQRAEFTRPCFFLFFVHLNTGHFIDTHTNLC